MKHNPEWNEVLRLFDENEQQFRVMPPAEPMPEAEFCRQSAHRTLGHLTACQVAWLPLMQRIAAKAKSGVVKVHPLRLYVQLDYTTKPWNELLEQFLDDRSTWRDLLNRVDLDHPLKTTTRVHTAKTLTEKLVRHEATHLAEIPLPT